MAEILCKEKVYLFDDYFHTWIEIIGYDDETQELISKRITPINGDPIHDENLGKIKRNRYTVIKMKFLSLKVIERRNMKWDDFCKEIFKTCREAYRILHFQTNIPDRKFNKEGCIKIESKRSNV